MIDQELEKDILDNVLYSKKFDIQLNCCRIKKSWLDNHIPNAYTYLLNRFQDTDNIPEILYRIYHNIENAPICESCGNKPCRFIDFNKGYTKTCSKQCTSKLDVNNTQYSQISDIDIINHFFKDGVIISTYASKHHCQLYGYYNYLYNRFDDASSLDSIGELLYRIKNNIEVKPVCPICGKPVKFKRTDSGYRKYCSLACSRKSEEYYQHKRNTRCKTKELKWSNLGYNIKFDPFDINTYLVYDKCEIHNPFKISSMTFFNRWNEDTIMCPICNPERNPETSIEQIIKTILDKNNIEYVQHNRSILAPKELDFYLPIYNIGIECNGIYWHNGEEAKYKTIEKYKLANDKNVQLLTFWEDDIHNKKDIIESIIKTKCGKNSKIYARNCIIKEIDSKTSREFINSYHLQGNVNASIRLGLFYNETLVQVMTFGKLRSCMGSYNDKSKKVYELYRLCSKSGISVVGGPSKLLSYFKKHFDYDEVISYCHNEISNGNVYKQIGFGFVSECGQGYTYYNYKISKNRINRYSLRKSIIDDGSGNSADDILKQQGYLKCYDAGVKKYKITNKQDCNSNI